CGRCAGPTRRRTSATPTGRTGSRPAASPRRPSGSSGPGPSTRAGSRRCAATATRARSSWPRPWTTCSASTPPPGSWTTGCTRTWPPPTCSTARRTSSCAQPTRGRCAASPNGCWRRPTGACGAYPIRSRWTGCGRSTWRLRATWRATGKAGKPVSPVPAGLEASPVMDTSESALRATGLVKDYRRGRAVDGVDLAVSRGERVALLGPNGAGKTTTLLMCLGAVRPDAGTVRLLGHRLPRERSRAMTGVGFAAGYLPLPSSMRVIECLRMYGRLYGLRRPDVAARAGLDRLGIGHLARAMGTELSSGQKTLVGIVKATLHRPSLLVLDEPTASLDPDVALRVRTGLHELCAEQGTALL